jgi:hypothetical protein
LRQAAVAQKQEFLKVSFGSILLKKSAMVSTAEKYAPEIEICVLSKDSQAQIWRSCAKKRHFGSQYERSLEGPTFSTQSAKSSRSIHPKKDALMYHQRLVIAPLNAKR